MDNLKPCPFCGGKAKFVINSHVNSDTTQWHKVMCEDVFGCGAELGDALSGYSPDYEEQVKALKKKWNRRVNAVKVRPVKKGEWQKTPQSLLGEQCQCSVCGQTFWGYMAKFPFCASCGANMRGKADG